MIMMSHRATPGKALNFLRRHWTYMHMMALHLVRARCIR